MLSFEATVIGCTLIPLSLALYFFYLYKLNPSLDATGPEQERSQAVAREEHPSLPVDTSEMLEDFPFPADSSEEMEDPARVPVDSQETMDEPPSLPVDAPESAEESPFPPEPRVGAREAAIRDRTCPHYIGYLTHLPRGSPFPDECFGCRQVVRCMRIEPAQVVESFYLENQT